MRRRFATITLLSVFAGTTTRSANAEPLRYGGDRDFHPYEFLDANGRPQGFQIDLLDALARIAHFQPQIRLDEWPAIEGDFRAGRLDAIALCETRNRREWAYFTRSHATPVVAVYRRSGTPAPIALTQLAGHSITVPDTEPMRQTVADFFSAEHYRFTSVPGMVSALTSVRDGKSDYALLPRAYGDKLLASGTVSGVVAGDFNLRLQTYAFAVAPDNASLHARLNAALGELEQSGRLEALRIKWLGSHRSVALQEDLAQRLHRHRKLLLGVGGSALIATTVLGLLVRQRTQRASAERRRRKDAEAALQGLRDRLDRAFTRHRDPMLITEHSTGIVLDVNDALCELVGAARNDLIGQAVEAVPGIVDPGSVAMLRAILDQDGLIENEMIEIRRADGATRSCLVMAEMFQTGENHHVFTIIRDLTEQIASDAELRAAYDALADSLREQAQALARAQADLDRTDRELQAFAASVSHDLRWPLRVISGFSEMLRHDLDAGLIAEATQHAERIDRASRRMDEMLNALTKLARLNQHPVDIAPIDMAAMAREAWAQIVAADPEREVELTIANLPIARGDRGLIHHVWANLLSNAFKYTSRTADAKVIVDYASEGDRTWYRVSDNGRGFDMSLAKKLFEPFKRLHSESEFPGTGLGLHIVRRIVRRHGGDVRAHGEPGYGATFGFTLDPGAAPERNGSGNGATSVTDSVSTTSNGAAHGNREHAAPSVALRR